MASVASVGASQPNGTIIYPFPMQTNSQPSAKERASERQRIDCEIGTKLISQLKGARQIHSEQKLPPRRHRSLARLAAAAAAPSQPVGVRRPDTNWPIGVSVVGARHWPLRARGPNAAGQRGRRAAGAQWRARSGKMANQSSGNFSTGPFGSLSGRLN